MKWKETQLSKISKNKVIDEYFSLLNMATRKTINIVIKYKLPSYSITLKHASWMYLIMMSQVKILLHSSAVIILKKKIFFFIFFFFLIIFPQSSRVHITRAVLEQFLSFAKYLDGLSHGAPLLKQLCDHILFNPAIWIHTPAKVMVHRHNVMTLLQQK